MRKIWITPMSFHPLCDDVGRKKDGSCYCHVTVWWTTADKFTAWVDWCYKSFPGRHTVQIPHHVDPVSIVHSSERNTKECVRTEASCSQQPNDSSNFRSRWPVWAQPRAFVITDQLLDAVQIHPASFLLSPITLNSLRTLMGKSKHTKYAFSRAAQNESTAAAEGKQADI